MNAPRGLTPEEAEAWERLASTVIPLQRQVQNVQGTQKQVHRGTPPAAPTQISSPPQIPADYSELLAKGIGSTASREHRAISVAKTPPDAGGGLDSHWDRRLKSGAIAPDFTLDLHDHTLDRAYARLESGLAQACATGARVVLVIAGKPRPVDAADRSSRRGAIRAKLLDWLAAGPHAAKIAAIRKAHRRHGGEGALYLVLRKPR